MSHDGVADLTLTEAAARLSTSREALRRRLQRGTVQGYQMDGTWRVTAEVVDALLAGSYHAPSPSAQPRPVAVQVATSAPEAVGAMLRLADSLDRQTAALEQQATAMHRHSDLLERALAVPALTETSTPVTTPVHPQEAGVDDTPGHPRPWWRFW